MYPELHILNSHFSSYKFMMVISILVACFLSYKNLKRLGVTNLEFYTFFLGIIILFPMGARGLNVLLNWSYYQLHPSQIFIMATRGFSVVGGVIVSAFWCFIYCKLFKKSFRIFSNALVIPFLISFSLMKMGCFLNGCCFGKTTDSFLGVQLLKTSQSTSFVSFLKSISGVSQAVYPTPIIEALFALLCIPLGYALMKIYPKLQNQKSVLYFILFIVMRLIIHPIRVFPYNSLVTNVYYPLFYIILLSISMIKLFRRSKSSLFANK